MVTRSVNAVAISEEHGDEIEVAVRTPVRHRRGERAENQICKNLGLVRGGDLAHGLPTRNEFSHRLPYATRPHEFATALGADVEHLAHELAIPRTLDQVATHGFEELLKALGKRPRVARQVREQCGELQCALAREVRVQVLTRFEVIEEGPQRDVGTVTDVFQAGREDALRLKELDRSLQQSLTVLLSAASKTIDGVRL